jgi:hypothetical protein
VDNLNALFIHKLGSMPLHAGVIGDIRLICGHRPDLTDQIKVIVGVSSASIICPDFNYLSILSIIVIAFCEYSQSVSIRSYIFEPNIAMRERSSQSKSAKTRTSPHLSRLRKGQYEWISTPKSQSESESETSQSIVRHFNQLRYVSQFDIR